MVEKQVVSLHKKYPAIGINAPHIGKSSVRLSVKVWMPDTISICIFQNCGKGACVKGF